MVGKWIKMLTATALTITLSNALVYGTEIVKLKLFYDGKMQQYQAQEVQITLDGQKLSTGDMPAVIINDRTLIPVRAITEAMGAEVSWNDALKEAYITKNKDIVVLQLENKKGNKNGQTFNMDVPPKAINDRTMIPVRAFAETFDCQVLWQENSRTVVITTISNPVVPENPSTPETPATPEKPSTPETPVTPEKPSTPETPVKPVTPEKPVVPITPNPPSTGNILVNSISLPTNDSQDQGFAINTSGVINKYEEIKLDDKRIVVDIYNSEKTLTQDNITVNNHAFVSGIRSAQHNINGVSLTRIVFDLKSAASYTISKSADQKSIQLSFQMNKVQSIDISQSNGTDIVSIKGESPIAVTVSQLQSPRRLVLQIPNCQSYSGVNPNMGTANFITSATVDMSGASTVQLTLPVNAMVEYTTSQNGNQFLLHITKSSLNNISYDSASHTLTLAKITAMDMAGIVHTDNYLIGNYKLALPGNFASVYGQGNYQIEDDILKNVQIFPGNNGNTVLQFNTKKIRAFVVTSDNNNYYIQAKSPKDVYDKVLVLDAGHGLQDPGTSGNGLVEKNLNLIVATKIYEKMQRENGIKTYITRLDDSYPNNASRAAMANEIGDFFVSIHMNSVAGSALTNGTELLYTPHSNETGGNLSSQIAATILQKKLITALSTTDRGIKNRPDLLVLNQTTVPAVIVEVAFLSNPGDALKVSTPDGQEKASQAIYEGILELMNNYRLR